jgi:hypothetical protein
MKKFGRTLKVSLFIALLLVTIATVFAAGQDTTASTDESTAYPADQPSDYPANQPSEYPSAQAPAPPSGKPSPSIGQQVDPPGRVARLGYMTGSVSVQPRGTDDWVQGSVNRPLTNADNVWADKDSRAELNLGTGVFRISSETSLTLTNIDNNAVQVQLHQGTLNLHIRKLYDGEVYEVDTPNMAFTVTKSGDYRFDVDPNADSTRVNVWKGEGEATGQGPALRVHAGEQAQFTVGNSLTHQISPVSRPDGFDQWCQVRDKRQDESVSAQYVAPGVVGASDLDEYGSWRQTPDYGNVWVPTSVPPDWAPYRNGHWAWVDPWGWTWVDDAPWGFAPFHYGRWVSFGGYWGWAPGPYWVRPYYAPALVAWFGGPGWGVSFGFGFGGGFGWCPLGFGEPFFPWYGASRGYFRNVNISNTRIVNITNITNNYYNYKNGPGIYGRHGIAMPKYANNPRALTAVPRGTLERGLPVAQAAARTSPSALRGISSIGKPDVSPTRASLLGPKAGLPAARPSNVIASRPTVSRMTPPAASRPSAVPPARNGAVPLTTRPQMPSSARSLPQPAGRFIPKPPQALASSSPAPSPSRTANTAPTANRITPRAPMSSNVPRPPLGGIRGASAPTPAVANRPGSSPIASSMPRSVPRPPQGAFNQPAFNQPASNQPTTSARNIAPSIPTAPRAYSTPYFGRGNPSSSVPRPTGRILPAPQQAPSVQSRGNYTARTYNGGSTYGGYNGHSNPSVYRGYSGSSGYNGSSGYSGSSPAYRGYSGSAGYGGGSRGYSAPSHGGSYGGGHSYSAPSSHASSSYGVGGFHGSSGGSHGSSGGSSSSHSGHR